MPCLNSCACLSYLHIISSFVIFFKTRLPGNPKKRQGPRRYHQSLRLVSFEAWSSSTEGSYMHLLPSYTGWKERKPQWTQHLLTYYHPRCNTDPISSYREMMKPWTWIWGLGCIWKCSKWTVMMRFTGAKTFLGPVHTCSVSWNQCVDDSNSLNNMQDQQHVCCLKHDGITIAWLPLIVAGHISYIVKHSKCDQHQCMNLKWIQPNKFAWKPLVPIIDSLGYHAISACHQKKGGFSKAVWMSAAFSNDVITSLRFITATTTIRLLWHEAPWRLFLLCTKLLSFPNDMKTRYLTSICRGQVVIINAYFLESVNAALLR